MNDIEERAWHLVVNDKVRLDDSTFRVDHAGIEVLDTASGAVKASDDSVWYDVSIDPSGCECSCIHGETRPGVTHTHDLALRLAAYRQRGTA